MDFPWKLQKNYSQKRDKKLTMMNSRKNLKSIVNYQELPPLVCLKEDLLIILK